MLPGAAGWGAPKGNRNALRAAIISGSVEAAHDASVLLGTYPPRFGHYRCHVHHPRQYSTRFELRQRTCRTEEAARAHGVRCVISSAVTKVVDSKRLRPLGEEQVKGISAPVSICAYEIGPAIGS